MRSRGNERQSSPSPDSEGVRRVRRSVILVLFSFGKEIFNGSEPIRKYRCVRLILPLDGEFHRHDYLKGAGNLNIGSRGGVTGMVSGRSGQSNSDPYDRESTLLW